MICICKKKQTNKTFQDVFNIRNISSKLIIRLFWNDNVVLFKERERKKVRNKMEKEEERICLKKKGFTTGS